MAIKFDSAAGDRPRLLLLIPATAWLSLKPARWVPSSVYLAHFDDFSGASESCPGFPNMLIRPGSSLFEPNPAVAMWILGSGLPDTLPPPRPPEPRRLAKLSPPTRCKSGAVGPSRPVGLPRVPYLVFLCSSALAIGISSGEDPANRSWRELTMPPLRLLDPSSSLPPNWGFWDRGVGASLGREWQNAVRTRRGSEEKSY